MYRCGLPGYNGKILSLHTRGITTRDTLPLAPDIGRDGRPSDLIYTMSAVEQEEMREWQNRPLEEVYTLVCFDAITVSVHTEDLVVNKPACVATGVLLDDTIEVLGIWLEKKEECVKSGFKVIAELQRRGVRDIFVACIDGLKGFPEAFRSLFPLTQIYASNGAGDAGAGSREKTDACNRQFCEPRTPMPIYTFNFFDVVGFANSRITF